MKDDLNTIEFADRLNHWYEIIIPKLENIRNHSGGAKIHNANTMISRCNAYHKMMNDQIEKPLKNRNIDYYARQLENFLNEAERFLIDGVLE